MDEALAAIMIVHRWRGLTCSTGTNEDEDDLDKNVALFLSNKKRNLSIHGIGKCSTSHRALQKEGYAVATFLEDVYMTQTRVLGVSCMREETMGL